MIPYPLRIGAPAVLLALVLVLAPAPAARAADEFALPELALDSASARGVARTLARVGSMELFIAGSSARYPKSGAARKARLITPSK